MGYKNTYSQTGFLLGLLKFINRDIGLFKAMAKQALASHKN